MSVPMSYFQGEPLKIGNETQLLIDDHIVEDRWALERVIKIANLRGVTSSICGQAPSFYPDLTERLVEWGITSVSVSPDMIGRTRGIIYQAERNRDQILSHE